jgi:hypothetical protein
MAAILEREPVPVSTLQPATPALVAGIVEKCLAKNPDDRWQNAADLSSALRLAAAGAGTRGTLSEGTAPHSRRWWPRTAVGTALVALAAVAGGAALAWRYAASSVAPPAESRFEVAPPPGTTWSPSPIASTVQIALSPDGRRLAFVAGPRGSAPQIWIRPLDSVQAQPLAGTDDATFPFWSPDGRFIGFFAGGKLKKVDVTGGTQQVLAEVAPLGRGGAWNAEDIILFTPAPNRGIWSVPAAGGSPTPVTSLPTAERATNHVWPQFLTDGRRFIYYQRSNDTERQGVYVSALGSEESTQVLRNDGMGVLAPGHLLVVRDGTLFAQAIDDECGHVERSSASRSRGPHAWHHRVFARLGRGHDDRHGPSAADHRAAVARPHPERRWARRRPRRYRSPASRWMTRTSSCRSSRSRPPARHLILDLGTSTGVPIRPPTGSRCAARRPVLHWRAPEPTIFERPGSGTRRAGDGSTSPAILTRPPTDGSSSRPARRRGDRYVDRTPVELRASNEVRRISPIAADGLSSDNRALRGLPEPAACAER